LKEIETDDPGETIATFDPVPATLTLETDTKTPKISTAAPELSGCESGQVVRASIPGVVSLLELDG